MGDHEDTISERIARNQSTFRDANERLEAAAGRLADLDLAPFICECPRPECTQVVTLTLDDYEDIRSDPARFWSVPGHEVCEVDGVTVAKVLERRDGYSVLEKLGRAAEVATELDGRS
jgi:hypothetical protein